MGELGASSCGSVSTCCCTIGAGGAALAEHHCVPAAASPMLAGAQLAGWPPTQPFSHR